MCTPVGQAAPPLPVQRRFAGRGAALVLLALGMATAIASLPLMAGTALALGFSLSLLVLVRPVVGLAVLALSVPFGALLEIQVSGVAIAADEALVAVLALSWAALVLSRRQRIVHVPLSVWPVALLVGVLAFELTLAPTPAVGVKELLRWGELLTVALIGSNILRQRGQITAVLAVILVAGVAEALIGWHQFLLQVGPPSFEVGRFMRAYGTFNQPNPFAGYLGMVWPLAVSLGVFWLIVSRHSATSQGSRVASVPHSLGLLALWAVGAIGVAILMSFSRGAWLGLGVGAAVLAGLHRRWLFALLVVAAGSAIALVVLGQFNILPGTLAARVNDAVAYFRIFDVRSVQVTAQNWALVERMASWQAAWGMFEAAPIFGVGPGHFVAAYARYALPDWPQPLGHAHNYYLNVLAETGAVGLGAYLLALGTWFGEGLICLRRLHGATETANLGFERAAVFGVLGALAAAAVHNLFDNLYVHGMNVHVGLLLGIMFAAGQRAADAGGDRQRLSSS